ncbi:MAG: sulfur carrier protein ThiS, partial [Opitutaceae bacterium]
SRTSSALRVFVNDRPREMAAGGGLGELVRELGLADKAAVAVAVNGVVAPRSGWADRKLEAGDRVLVIQATQGG